jgi:hypothetical protein
VRDCCAKAFQKREQSLMWEKDELVFYFLIFILFLILINLVETKKEKLPIPTVYYTYTNDLSECG